MKYFIHLPMKMEPIVSSKTSAIRTQTPGNYPKRNKLHLEHGESLKTRIHRLCPKNIKPHKTKLHFQTIRRFPRCLVISSPTTSFFSNYHIFVDCDSSVGISTCDRLGGPGIECQCGRGLPHPPKLAWGPASLL